MPYQLDRHVPYLIARLAALVREVIAPVLTDYDITLPMWRVLGSLAEKKEQTVGDLLLATSLEQSTLSRTLSALENRGLIAKKINLDDGRTISIALVARGRALTQRLQPHWDDAHTSLVSGVSKRDLETFIRVVDQLYRNASVAIDTPTARMRLRATARQ